MRVQSQLTLDINDNSNIWRAGLIVRKVLIQERNGMVVLSTVTRKSWPGPPFRLLQ
jgi:hypothetical protein